MKKAKKKKQGNCLCPLNHADKKALNVKLEIRGIPIIVSHEIQAAGLIVENKIHC